jgi:hypothetical protein
MEMRKIEAVTPLQEKRVDPKQKKFMLDILDNLEFKDYIDGIPDKIISGPPEEGGKYHKIQTSWTSTITALFTGVAKEYLPNDFVMRVKEFLVEFQEGHKDGGKTTRDQLEEAGKIIQEGRRYIQLLEENEEDRQIKVAA